jgi:hypothetical protein
MRLSVGSHELHVATKPHLFETYVGVLGAVGHVASLAWILWS